MKLQYFGQTILELFHYFPLECSTLILSNTQKGTAEKEDPRSERKNEHRKNQH